MLHWIIICCIIITMQLNNDNDNNDNKNNNNNNNNNNDYDGGDDVDDDSNEIKTNISTDWLFTCIAMKSRPISPLIGFSPVLQQRIYLDDFFMRMDKRHYEKDVAGKK